MASYAMKAVLFQEAGWWVAQCLEHDIAVASKTRDDALYQLERSLVGRIAVALEVGRQPFKGLPEAPPRYWRMFEEAVPVDVEIDAFEPSQLPIEVRPKYEVRELAA